MKKNIIYGMHPVMEAIKSGQNIDKLFLQNNLKGQASRKLIELLEKHNLSYKTVPIEKLNRLTGQNHQGVVAFISPIKILSLDDLLSYENDSPYKTYLLLDGITDTKNLGAIIRTAVATDITGIIIPENNSAPINDEVVKTSAGGIFKIPIARVKHLLDAVYMLQSNDIKVFAASEKAKDLVYHANLKQDFALIMGSEGKGINKNLLKNSDRIFRLPMSSKIQSLNVSVATGIILYEAVRQRLK